MNGPVRAMRDDLLARHAELRSAVDDVRAAVYRVREGVASTADLQHALGRLADTLRAHCAHEDEVLGDVIRTIDAWGDARAEVLEDEHTRECRELDEAVAQADATTDAERLFMLTIHCIERLLEHFSREERFVLAEDVLSDDIIPRNSFSG